MKQNGSRLDLCDKEERTRIAIRIWDIFGRPVLQVRETGRVKSTADTPRNMMGVGQRIARGTVLLPLWKSSFAVW